MTKFTSIWGDLTVGSVTPAPAGNEAAQAAASQAPAKAKNELDADDTSSVDNEEDDDIVATITPAAKKDGEEPEGGEGKPKDAAAPEGETNEEKAAREAEEQKAKDVLTFSDDDIAKAYTMLLDEGVLELDEADEFEQSVSGIGDAVAATVRNKLKAEIAAIPPVVQDFYAFVMEGKDPKSWQVPTQMKWADADLTDVEVQKASLKALYLDQGMTEEDADEEIQDAIAADKLEKKAAIAVTALVKKDEELEAKKAKAEEAQRELEKKKQLKEIADIEKSIDDADEYAGFKLDEKKKQAFKDYLFKVNPRTGKTQLQENMANPDRKMTVAFLDFVNYTKADLEKEVADGLTRDRKKKLARFTDKNLGNKNSSQTVTTNVNKNKGKIKFPTIFGAQTIEIED